jgi:hypothetical protein
MSSTLRFVIFGHISEPLNLPLHRTDRIHPSFTWYLRDVELYGFVKDMSEMFTETG